MWSAFHKNAKGFINKLPSIIISADGGVFPNDGILSPTVDRTVICSSHDIVFVKEIHKSLQIVFFVTLVFFAACMVWYAPPVAAAQPESAEETIIVGGNANYPPYEFIDKDGNPSGFNIDLTRAVAKAMGMNVRIELGTYAERIKALEDGKIDAMGGFSYSDERAKLFDFSPPHTIINLAVFGRKDSPKLDTIDELREKKIIVMAGGRMQELMKCKGLGGCLVFTGTYVDGLRMLASGEYDYMLMGLLPGMYLIKEHDLSNIVVMKEVEQQRYCFAVRKGNRELQARFSEGLAIVKKTGQYNRIYDKWIGVYEPRGVPWTKVIRIGSIITALFIGVLFVTLLWSRTLKKQVAQRTASLALEVKERQRVEDELRHNQENLVQTEKLAAIGTLVSGVAHEINNPNGLILLNTKMMKEMYPEILEMMETRYRVEGDFVVGKWQYSEVRENLEHMMIETLEASNRIGRIVEDLKNFGRRESSGLNEMVDLNIVAETAIRLIENTIKKFTDFFDVHYAQDLPTIRGNVQRIEQVIVNLLLNACQALPDRDRHITVVLRYDPVHQMVEFEVADEGIGIEPDRIQYITDPFYTTKREQGGTGLGLSVSTGIAKDHGGHLTFRSVLGKGTIVTLSLPIPGKGSHL